MDQARIAYLHPLYYTYDNEKQARRAAQQFEETRQFFESIWRKLDRDKPIYIFSFDGDKRYDSLGANKISAAFYSGGIDADYIVLRDLTAASFPIAVHEFVHLLVRHSGLKLPVWLNEGLAELYSTIEDRDHKVLVGQLPPYHLGLLNSKQLLPLNTLLTVTHDSPHYNERDKASIFYAQSWALTHMLSLDKRYGDNFPKLMKACEREAPTAATLEAVFGKPIVTIEKDLEKYIRQSLYRGLLFDTKLKNADAVFTKSTPAPGEADLALSGVFLTMREFEKYAAQVEATAQANPQAAGAAEKLAILASRRQQFKEEARWLIEADRLGSKNPTLMMRLASLTQMDADRTVPNISALTRILDQFPDHMDVRIALSSALNRAKRPVQAYAIFNSIRTVAPAKAPRFFLTRASAYANAKEFERAIADANQGLSLATEDADRQYAQSLIASLTSYQKAIATGVKAADLVMPTEEIATLTPQQVSAEATGTFEHLACPDGKLIVHLRTADNELLKLWLETPDRLQIEGLGAYTVDLNCGPQPKPERLTVTYVPKPNATLNTSGSATKLKYHRGQK